MNNETSYFYCRLSVSKKYFYVSLCINFFYCFCGGPLVAEALSNCPVCPPLNPARTRAVLTGREHCCHIWTLGFTALERGQRVYLP